MFICNLNDLIVFCAIAVYSRPTKHPQLFFLMDVLIDCSLQTSDEQVKCVTDFV